MSMRSDIVKVMQSWVGKNVANGSYKSIIDLYNSEKPLAVGYSVKYTDAWCDTTVSAAAIAAGIPRDIFPRECGCGRHIELFKKIGAWVENDAYVPTGGDVIFYDWDDGANFATIDNVGNPEHVGLVESVANGKITVIEGNKSQSVSRRIIDVNGRYIRGFAVPKYAEDKPVPVPASPADIAVDELAKAGIVSSPDHWKQAAVSGQSVYIKDLLVKFAAYVKNHP